MSAEGAQTPKAPTSWYRPPPTALKVLPIAAKHSGAALRLGLADTPSRSEPWLSHTPAIATLVRNTGAGSRHRGCADRGFGGFCGAIVNVLVGVNPSPLPPPHTCDTKTQRRGSLVTTFNSGFEQASLRALFPGHLRRAPVLMGVLPFGEAGASRAGWRSCSLSAWSVLLSNSRLPASSRWCSCCHFRAPRWCCWQAGCGRRLLCGLETPREPALVPAWAASEDFGDQLGSGNVTGWPATTQVPGDQVSWQERRGCAPLGGRCSRRTGSSCRTEQTFPRVLGSPLTVGRGGIVAS